jgi:porphobilinogen deaminase
VSNRPLLTAVSDFGLLPQVNDWLSTLNLNPDWLLLEETDMCFNAIRLGDAAVALLPLSQLPAFLPDDIVIGALSARENPAIGLLVHSAKADQNQRFNLPDQALVLVTDERLQAQLNDFVPGLRYRNIQAIPENITDLMIKHNADAALLPLSLSGLSSPDLLLTSFNPAEMVPAPGEGVWALCCARADTHTRRLLKGLHHPAVAAATNIERLILRQAEASVAAYVAVDAQNNYHVHAVSFHPIRKTRLSSTTNFQLAERVLAQLALG